DGSRIHAAGALSAFGDTVTGAIVRLQHYGALDASFVSGTGPNSSVYAIAEDPFTNELVIGGIFTSYAGNTAATRLAKVAKTGTLSDQFAIGAGANADIWAIHVDGSRIHAAGALSAFGDTVTGAIVRLQHYGALD
ncbi:MAG: hypothetical protein IT459_08360, partial [Planctomycetes bacterium]|nr:hypothetical protein [Planctomycetota bacterium]